MNEHTKGPWKYSTNVGPTRALIVEEDGSTILNVTNSGFDSRFEANVQRIVQCVNACEGYANPDLMRKRADDCLKERAAAFDMRRA